MLVFSNEEIDVIKIALSLEDAGLLIKGLSKAVENDVR